MLKRKIDDALKEWKKKKDKLPLIVQGGRQVGKTTSIINFGKNNYSKFYKINFIETPSAMEAFLGDLSPIAIMARLSLVIPDFIIEDGDTLIFLDEIQECPEARTSLKFLSSAKNVDIIASGSLLGIKYKNVVSYPVGYVDYLTMYPMDYEEFLWANGIQEQVIENLKECFVRRAKVDNFIHSRLLELFRTYLVVGGMPRAVENYKETNNFSTVQEIQKAIMKDYELDIIKYADSNEKQKIRSCFLSIPRQLAKENRKFQYSAVEKGSSARKYGASVLWLSDANVVNFCHNLSTLELPLKAYEEENNFKLYLADTGLLTSQYEDGTALNIITDNIGRHKGAIYENAVAQMLTAKGYRLYFFKPSQNMEIDFIIRFEDSACPIEVKSSDNTRSKSLNSLLLSGKYRIKKAIKLSTKNIGEENGIISLPIYLAFLL